MNSRMERYYKANPKVSKRSEKNKELYYETHDIDAIGRYSNIEAVAPLDKTNEVDIDKIKSMLKSREVYKRQREYQRDLDRRIEVEERVPEVDSIQTKSYDIKEELEKIRTSKDTPTYRTLDDTSYQVLKQLKIKKENEIKEYDKEEDMEGQTLVNTQMLKKLNDEQLSLNMFEDLASSENTIANTKAITALLEEAKRIDEKQQKEREEKKIDNSFYTSSLDIDRKDFEGLYDKSNFSISPDRKIKIVAIVTVLAILLFIIVMIIKFK